MRNHYNTAEISSALASLREFIQDYEEKDGIQRVGDISDLVDKADVIEFCMNKQRNVPANAVKQFKLFGKMEWIKFCNTCGTRLDSEQGCFCPKCGQRFC